MSKGSSRRQLHVEWDPEQQLWMKVSNQLAFFEHSEPYSETWPSSGSMRNGRSWQRPPSALPTDASASSSTPGRLLPTPRPQTKGGCDAVEAPPNRQGGPNLATAISLLPTPRTSDTNGAGKHGDGGMDLRTAVSLLPTPNASDCKGSGATQGRMRDGKPRPLSDADLPEAVKLLPTPMAGDAKGTRSATAGRSKDNPNVNLGWTLSDVVYAGELPNPSAPPVSAPSPTTTPRGSVPAASTAPTPNSDSPASAPKTAPSAPTKLLPTPRATRGGSGIETMYGLGGERTDESRPQGEVLLPTPTTSDGERTSLSYGRGNLTLTGAITKPPSDGGSESSDDQPPGQLTLLDD